MSDTNTTEEKKPEIIDINNMSVDELRALREKNNSDSESTDIITDTPEEIREQQEAEPSSEYNIEIVSKPAEGGDGITVKGDQSVAKEEDGQPDATKEELSYAQFADKYPDLKDKINEEKFKEMFKVETPATPPVADTPVEFQKVTIDSNDEVAITNIFDSSVRSDTEIRNILLKAGLKEFPKSEDEMDAFAEGFPRQYLQFERRQGEIAESVTKGYISKKEIEVNAPFIANKNLTEFGDLVYKDIEGLYPNFEKDKDSLEKGRKAIVDFYTKARNDPRYFNTVNGKSLPSKEKLYTGFVNSNRELYRDMATKGVATPIAKAGDGKKIIEEIKRHVKNTPITSLQDNVKSGSGNVSKTVNIMDDNEATSLSLSTLKAMQSKIRTKL